MTRRFRIIVSCASAVLAATLFAAYAKGVREEAERVRLDALERYGGEVVTLVVARTALEPGDVVSTSNVVMREWLADLAPEGAVTSLDEIVGLEVGVPLSKGAPLTSVTFRDASEMAEVPLGCVAVTLPLTDKLGVPRSIAVGSELAAYVVSAEGTSLVSQGMTVLAAPSASTAFGSALQMTVAVASQDVPAVLSAAATSDLRLVVPAKDVDTEGLGAGSDAPLELELEDGTAPDAEEATDDEAESEAGQGSDAAEAEPAIMEQPGSASLGQGAGFPVQGSRAAHRLAVPARSESASSSERQA